MCAIFGKEKGAGSKIARIGELVWYDLTAGDGIVDDSAPCGYSNCQETGCWIHNCSPGIVAHYGRNSPKPLTAILYEIQSATFDLLDKSLAMNLPELGYRFQDGWWRCGLTRLRAEQCSGAGADLTYVNAQTAVLASNDPNAITDWAMRPTFAAEIRERTKFYRSISTMGCNANGIKRGIPREEREDWFALIEQQIANLPQNHDLMLARIVRDSHQWAYLFGEPIVWRDEAAYRVTQSFEKHGMQMESAWLRVQPSVFRKIEDELFWTKQERSA